MNRIQSPARYTGRIALGLLILHLWLTSSNGVEQVDDLLACRTQPGLCSHKVHTYIHIITCIQAYMYTYLPHTTHLPIPPPYIHRVKPIPLNMNKHLLVLEQVYFLP
ncbi:hypothetical protein BO71DRAFT_100989 [Aspergillus ellipticus CBS 707.79]|uniref:Secreted protein n=1 Tax=Aspergillus ellipticus CBS 707.79 TaxID=1448320 RepID=A0A319EFB8_9EURO|nr:hypothetical protein BO71DRAFT_100989 [Aspergillus ellipticus CBS 707.79]